ncbi:hypothetical protein [Streptomyces sp. NPDC101455]|uniref:hypothetical protein n=1 Tax=Streptomyces sp. NPDC101455 TaxID=3366142 RepID=UPI00380DF429
MNETLTLDSLTAALRVLRVLTVDFGHLPAPTVYISPLDPDRLEVAFHGGTVSGLPGFEAWREALDVAPDAVDFHMQGEGHTAVLRVVTAYAGAELELVGYGDIAAPVLVGGAV